MNKKFTAAFTFFILFFFSYALGNDAVRGDFVIFPSFTGNSIYDSILKGCESAIIDASSRAGCVVPVEYNYKKAAIEKSDGSDRAGLYRNAALYLKADMLAVLTVSDQSGEFIATVSLVPVTEKYHDLKKEITVRSRVPENIPLKAAREFALMFKKRALSGRVIRVYDDGSALIDSGQWHGLNAGSYQTSAGDVEIKTVSRYTSVIRGRHLAAGTEISFGILPDIKNYIDELDHAIRENTVRKYGTDEILNRRDGSVRESIQGTCVINQGASFCAPGYGSFLSIEYMGIEKGKADYPAIAITGSLTVLQIGLVPYMTGFDAEFLPWVDDSARSSGERRLNYFLWGALPLTFTASFYSQLAYNYHIKNMLPPQFTEHDMSASLLSVFVPGGGLFYKGYRWAGWGVYLAEMSMAGYAVYTDDRDMRMKLVAGVAAAKTLEVLISYIIPPSYSFFNREIAASHNLDFSVGIKPSHDSGSELTAAVSFRY